MIEKNWVKWWIYDLMAYDEHWATSPVSGSVASIGWVDRGVSALLEDVPSEKVILGLPFYTGSGRKPQRKAAVLP